FSVLGHNLQIVGIQLLSERPRVRIAPGTPKTALCGGLFRPFRRDENAVRIGGSSRLLGAASLSFKSKAAPYRAGDARKSPNLGLFSFPKS
ncbi:MAG: hypothetical protein Q4B07_08695, partial [Clostridia bacterium]|nr:hypothetical protein [Clostridia bacterium]